MNIKFLFSFLQQNTKKINVIKFSWDPKLSDFIIGDIKSKF